MPALEGHRLVALLVARDVGTDLDVGLVDRSHELRPLTEAGELHAYRRVGRDVGSGDVQHDLVLTGDLPEPMPLGEPKRCGVTVLDSAPERGEPALRRVLRERLVQRRPNSLLSVLGQNARHRVEAAGDRRGPADAAAERFSAAGSEDPGALLVVLHHVRELVHVVLVALDPLHDRRPLFEVRPRRRRLEPKVHLTFAANTPPPP